MSLNKINITIEKSSSILNKNPHLIVNSECSRSKYFILKIIYFTEIIPTADEKVAFTDIDAAFLVGAMPRREGMERKDLLAANVKIFKSQGRALDQYAKKDVKVNLFC